MRKVYSRLMLLMVCLLASLGLNANASEVAVAGADGNFVENGSFEEWAEKVPVAWQSTTTASNATISQSTDARTGQYSVCVAGTSSNKRLASKEYVFAPGIYHVSFYAKAVSGAVAKVRAGHTIVKDGLIASNDYKYLIDATEVGSEDWTLLEFDMELTEETEVNMLVMSNKSGTGNDLLIDDFTVTAPNAVDPAEAPTAYFGLASQAYSLGDGNNGCVFGVKVNDPGTVVETPFISAEGNSFFVMAGTQMDDKYVALLVDEDSRKYKLASINMTTGTQVDLATVSYSYDISLISDMAYVPGTQKLYAIGLTENENEERVTALYEVSCSSSAFNKICTLPQELSALAYNEADGGLYGFSFASIAGDWWHTGLKMWRIDINGTEATAVDLTADSEQGLGLVSNKGTYVSAAFHEGVLYVANGRQFISYDGEELVIADTKLPADPAGITFVKSSADVEGAEEPQPAEEETGKVSVVETYGSNMGDTNEMSHRTLSFYDANNRLVREVTTGRNYSTGDFEMESYKHYDYNEAGQLVKVYSEQYGIYDGNDFAFKPSRNVTTYAYNEAGQLAEKTDGSYQYIYEYNEDGTLQKETRNSATTGSLVQEFNYFYMDGHVVNIISTSPYESYCYLADLGYDENDNKIYEVRSALGENGMPTDAFAGAEYWEYDEDGNLVEYRKSGIDYDEDGNPIECNELRTLYSFDNGNKNRVVAKSQIWDFETEQYYDNPVYTITETTEYNGEMFSPQLTVEAEAGQINTAHLKFSLPGAAMMGSCRFDVYRHGFLIKSISAMEIFGGSEDVSMSVDESTGTYYVNYLDREVKNGNYDYFVQTIQMLGEMGDEGEAAMNISNVVNYDHYVELPAVTEMRYLSNGSTGGNYIATIEWDEPEGITDELGFQRYNFIFYRGDVLVAVPDNFDTDGQATSWTAEFGNTPERSFIIQTVYKYGKSNSEKFTVNVLEDTPVGITSLNNGLKASYHAGVVTLSEATSVRVFNTAGQLVQQSASATSVDLNALPAGIYMVQAGKNVLKVKK